MYLQFCHLIAVDNFHQHILHYI